MLVETTVRFRGRRDPFPWDMTAQGGGTGTSYAFDALDMDDTKVKIKCSEQQWHSLASVARDTPIKIRVDVSGAKIDGDGLQVAAAKTQ